MRQINKVLETPLWGEGSEWKNYQRSLIADAVKAAKKQKKQAIRIQAPTGSGKTPIVAAIMAIVDDGSPFIILAKDTIIREQLRGAYNHYKEVLSIKGEILVECYAAFRIASEEESDKPKTARLRKALKECKYIFVDEAHAYGKNTAATINNPSSIEKIQTFAWQHNLNVVYGVSATMMNLCYDLFPEENMISATYQEVYQEGMLNQVQIHTIEAMSSIIDLDRFRNIDLKEKNQELYKDSRKKVSIPTRTYIEARVKAGIHFYKGNIDGKKCILFVPPRRAYAEYAYKIAKSFGIKAVRVHGGISKTKNDESVEGFKNGDTELLICVNMMREGFDMIPLCECIDTAYNPTMGAADTSLQKIGRVIRSYPDYISNYYIIEDNCGISFGGVCTIGGDERDVRDDYGDPDAPDGNRDMSMSNLRDAQCMEEKAQLFALQMKASLAISEDRSLTVDDVSVCENELVENSYFMYMSDGSYKKAIGYKRNFFDDSISKHSGVRVTIDKFRRTTPSLGEINVGAKLELNF